MNASSLKVGIKSALATCAVAAAFVAGPAVSEGLVRMNTTGGTACKGSSGFGAQFFYFANTSVLNTTNIYQFVTCGIPTANESLLGAGVTPTSVTVVGHNTTNAAIPYICALQAGSEDGVLTTSVYETTVAAGSSGYIVNASASSTPAIPASSIDTAPYSLSCYVAPGAKVGAISVLTPGHF